MISLPGTMTKRSSRVGPPLSPPRPTTMLRRARSFMSIVRGQVIRRLSIPSALPWWMWLSSMALRRLCAEVMAWKSPVKCRLISSIGITWAYPPPAAPPLTPNTGPSEGSRMQTMASLPSRRSAWVNPTVTVLFPSPAGVGEMPLTRTRRPLGLRALIASALIFALNFP